MIASVGSLMEKWNLASASLKNFEHEKYSYDEKNIIYSYSGAGYLDQQYNGLH